MKSRWDNFILYRPTSNRLQKSTDAVGAAQVERFGVRFGPAPGVRSNQPSECVRVSSRAVGADLEMEFCKSCFDRYAPFYVQVHIEDTKLLRHSNRQKGVFYAPRLIDGGARSSTFFGMTQYSLFCRKCSSLQMRSPRGNRHCHLSMGSASPELQCLEGDPGEGEQAVV